MTSKDENKSADLPSAVMRPEGRSSLIWIVPLLAAILVGWIGYRAADSGGAVVQGQDPHQLASSESNYRVSRY